MFYDTFKIILSGEFQQLNLCFPTCSDPESFVRGGPNLISFLIDWGIALIRSSSACQQNAIEMAFCWRADDGPTWQLCDFSVFRGSRPVLQKNPIFL